MKILLVLFIILYLGVIGILYYDLVTAIELGVKYQIKTIRTMLITVILVGVFLLYLIWREREYL